MPVTAEAKVGMFFLTALLLVGVIALYLGDFWVRARSYPVTAYFENVQGLASGAEVRFAGVKVGRVTAVTLESNVKFPKRPAAVKMAIFHDAMLYDGDQFVIQQSSLLGDKFVDVKRTNISPKDRLAAGSEVSGGGSVGMENLTEEARQLVREARATLGAVRNTYASESNKLMLQQILMNVSAATSKADTLASRAILLADILTKNAAKAGPNVVAMVSNLKDASLSVKNTAQLVRTLLATSPVPRDMAIAGGNIRKMTEDLSAISSSFAEVLANPDTRLKVQDAIDNLHQTTAHLAAVTAQADKVFGDGSAAKEVRDAVTRLHEAAVDVSDITKTYSKLLNDPAFTNDVRQTVVAARQAAECGAHAIARADRSLERVDATMAHVNKATGIFSPEEVRTMMSVEGSGEGGLRADTKINLQYGCDPRRFVRVGVRDVGDAETLILQKAFPLGRNVGRAGIYANKLGIGYDLNPQGKLGLETELWDPNDLHLDLRGTYGVGSRVDFLFGFNHVTDDPDAFVGVRYKTNP